MKEKNKNKFQHIFSSGDYLSKETTVCLKGIFSIIILLVHIRGNIPYFNDTVIGMMLTALGYLSVGVFFFLSGYGLYFSYIRDDFYFKNFPKNRILDFYIKYFIIVIVYSIVHSVMSDNFNFQCVPEALILKENVIIYGWYLQSILFLYLIFYFVMRFVPRKYKIIKITLIAIIYFIVVILLGHDFLWVESVLAFPVGMLWCEYKSKIDKYISGKKYWLFAVTIFVLFSVFLLLGNLNILNNTLKNISKAISAPIFVAMVMLFCKKININNIFTRKLGELSFEIYVFQGVFVNLFVSKYIYIDNPILYILISVSCTFIVSLIMHPVFKSISRKIKNYKYIRR